MLQASLILPLFLLLLTEQALGENSTAKCSSYEIGFEVEFNFTTEDSGHALECGFYNKSSGERLSETPEIYRFLLAENDTNTELKCSFYTFNYEESNKTYHANTSCDILSLGQLCGMFNACNGSSSMAAQSSMSAGSTLAQWHGRNIFVKADESIINKAILLCSTGSSFDVQFKAKLIEQYHTNITLPVDNNTTYCGLYVVENIVEGSLIRATFNNRKVPIEGVQLTYNFPRNYTHILGSINLTSTAEFDGKWHITNMTNVYGKPDNFTLEASYGQSLYALYIKKYE